VHATLDIGGGRLGLRVGPTNSLVVTLPALDPRGLASSAAVAAIGGAFIGTVGTLDATWLQNRHAEGERKATAAAASRHRAAEILGRVRTFLTDIDPRKRALASRVLTDGR
jgi:hypothetical protein